MEIKSGQLATQYQQNLKTQTKPLEKDIDVISATSNNADTLQISDDAKFLLGEGGGHPTRPKLSEAQQLFGEGGGHPTRPKK